MKILNLGCGTRTASHPDVLNVDWSVYLVLRKNPVLRRLAPLFAGGERLRRLDSLPDSIMLYDLTRKLPFGTGTIDVVYHSHLLEHFDPSTAERFLLEILRVLKPGGLQRIVVPDLEGACRAYLEHVSLGDGDPAEALRHDRFVAAIIEQCVRRESYGTSRQKPLRRFVENLVLGDAMRRGETHRWMYDRVNLRALLTRLGYRNPRLQTCESSSIPGWSRYGLDCGDGESGPIPGSLYLEAQK